MLDKKWAGVSVFIFLLVSLVYLLCEQVLQSVVDEH